MSGGRMEAALEASAINLLAKAPRDRAFSTKDFAEAAGWRCTPMVGQLSRLAKRGWLTPLRGARMSMFWMWRLTPDGIAALEARQP